VITERKRRLLKRAAKMDRIFSKLVNKL